MYQTQKVPCRCRYGDQVDDFELLVGPGEGGPVGEGTQATAPKSFVFLLDEHQQEDPTPLIHPLEVDPVEVVIQRQTSPSPRQKQAEDLELLVGSEEVGPVWEGTRATSPKSFVSPLEEHRQEDPTPLVHPLEVRREWWRSW